MYQNLIHFRSHLFRYLPPVLVIYIAFFVTMYRYETLKKVSVSCWYILLRLWGNN